MKKENKLLRFQNLAIYYFTGSFIGWTLEVIYAYILFGTFVNRGFLYGPMCPIYGCGIMIIVLIAEHLKNKKINNKILNLLFDFIIIMLIFSFLEYTISLVLELIFDLRWWDYTNEFCNLNGRICLGFSLLFGLFGTIFIKLIYEPSKNIINKIKEKIPSKILWVIIISLILLWLTDSVFSIIRYI